MLKFGIYTTFYNCERFVERIFNSVESLNYDNFEWHITDDFSIDNTKNLVLDRLEKSVLKHKIKYYEQLEKKQMYWKPNEFFDDTFEWIVLVDADDNFDKNFLNVYNTFLENKKNITFVSSDFIKINENDNSLHSISYVLNDDDISRKVERYHPSCDYLNNISYSCFGHLRAFKNKVSSFDVDDMLACAEDSYHVFWSNSFGKYLHIPRPLYIWYLREDSESHRKSVPPNFNGNFNIALNKLKQSDGGIDMSFNDIYIETSTLGSYEVDNLKGKKVSLWTRNLSERQKQLMTKLYYDSDLVFNEKDAEIHLFSLNYFNENNLDTILESIKGKKMLFYYQNQNYHETNEEKDQELQNQVNKYINVIGKHTGYSWWTYIRHFIIKN
jgi:glycosyltransferase involved in cell wall biosynthesis